MKLRQICSATLLGLATLTATLTTTATPAMAAEAASHPTVSPNRYLEMLSRDNAVLLLVDHQVGLLSGVRDTTVGELKHAEGAGQRRPRPRRAGDRDRYHARWHVGPHHA
ncbi:hypothetical protein [Aeromonas veronii]|uniref:hypothetical protein n=1 Tax=Aeromonas veronii TaxID=654 RepID=UPI003D219AF2